MSNKNENKTNKTLIIGEPERFDLRLISRLYAGEWHDMLNDEPKKTNTYIVGNAVNGGQWIACWLHRKKEWSFYDDVDESFIVTHWTEFPDFKK